MFHDLIERFKSLIGVYEELGAEVSYMPDVTGIVGTLIKAVIAIFACVAVFFILRIVLKSIKHYQKKKSLMTECEKQYYYALKSICGEKYHVFPQINLASVITKKEKGYRNELFRNADFGIFDHNFTPLVLIEVNDSSHLRADRKKRDKKVKKICKKAKLPLVTFNVKDGIDEKIMTAILSQDIDL